MLAYKLRHKPQAKCLISFKELLTHLKIINLNSNSMFAQKK